MRAATGGCLLILATLSAAPTATAARVESLGWPPEHALPGHAAASAPKLFPAPAELADNMRFWRTIFLDVASNRMVIHDREHLDVIWQVIELPQDGAGEVDRDAMNAQIELRMEDLEERLARLEDDPKPLDRQDRVLLSLAGGADSVRLDGAWRRLRAQRGVADRIAEGLERARRWLPEIRAILKEAGAPPELAALPLIESGFNPDARSFVGASGLWQLMPGTARGLGLTVKRGNDERNDRRKATDAAARMLLKNHEMLGNWPLAITGYNHGPYGLRRAVNDTGSSDLVHLIDNWETRSWGFSSKNFYAEFLVALEIIENLPPEQVALLP